MGYREDMPSPEAEVLAQNQAFYEAFARRDLEALDALWARRSPVVCIHPGWDALHGREEVMASWRAVLGDEPSQGAGAGRPRSGPEIRCTHPAAYVSGESAFVICGESIAGTELIATNVFVREEG